MSKMADEIIKLDLAYEPAGFEGKPVVVQTELSTFAVFNAVFSQRGEDGKYHKAGIAVVEFIH
jgi:hypothetical protein